MFFSVKKPMRIGEKVFTPCVCYSLPAALAETVKDLESKGKAKIYDHEVFFMNGQIMPTEEERKVMEKAEKKAKKEAEKKAKEAKKAEVSEETEKSVEDF